MELQNVNKVHCLFPLFSQKFDSEPHYALLKELFTQVCVQDFTPNILLLFTF